MRSDSPVRLVAVIAALHVAVLSVIFGLRHVGYMLAATLTALEAPLIPNWNHVESALPTFVDELRDAVRRDNTE